MTMDIYLYPLNGSFDVDRVRQVIEARPDILLDPCGSGTYMICLDHRGSSTRKFYGRQRIAEPTRFPYMGLILVAAEHVVVRQEYASDPWKESAREVVSWILENYRCRVLCGDYGLDFTERVAQHGPDVLYHRSA